LLFAIEAGDLLDSVKVKTQGLIGLKMAGEISTFALSPAMFPLCLLFFAMEAGI
jgi:hypothetical protein